MIATRSREVYLSLMTATRLVRVLTILAMLLAPLGMVGEHAAMAMPAAAAAGAHHASNMDQAGHCSEGSGQSEDEKAPASDCLIDCAIACSAIPAIGTQMAGHPPALAIIQPLSLVNRITGLHPESDPPPPRFA